MIGTFNYWQFLLFLLLSSLQLPPQAECGGASVILDLGAEAEGFQVPSQPGDMKKKKKKKRRGEGRRDRSERDGGGVDQLTGATFLVFIFFKALFCVSFKMDHLGGK